MDLAEIRKKATLRNAPDESVEQENRFPQTRAVEDKKLSSDVVVDGLWDAESGLPVTTEEEYAQNLLVEKGAGDENTVQWLTFLLGKEEYALELSSVLELIRPRHLTELPQVPDFLLGIVSLRGGVVPIIDLRRRLSLEPSIDDSQQRVIVCEYGDQRIGLLVDKVEQVARINKELLEPPPLVLDAPTVEFVAGVSRIQGRMLILLDPEKVMNIKPQAYMSQ